MSAGETEEQIQVIAQAVKCGAKTGVVVDDDAKADRYLKRLKELCPGLEVKFRGPVIKGKAPILMTLQLKGFTPSNN